MDYELSGHPYQHTTWTMNLAVTLGPTYYMDYELSCHPYQHTI